MQASKDMQTWIVVANRAGVRLFSNARQDESLRHEMEWDHPEGRLRAQEINATREGVTFSSAGPGQRRKEPSEDPTDHVAESFAQDVGAYLDSARHEGRFDRLVLVASPRFLGRLRGQLADATRRMVVGTIDKNLEAADEAEIRAQVQSYLT